jgi:hypothetical protein
MSTSSELQPPSYGASTTDIKLSTVDSSSYPSQQHVPGQYNNYPGLPSQQGGFAGPYQPYFPPPPQPIIVMQQQMQQQQQQQSTTVYVEQVVLETFAPQKTLACLTFWFCNFLFGLVAFILASKLTQCTLYHYNLILCILNNYASC